MQPRSVNFDERSMPQRSMPSSSRGPSDPRRKSGIDSESVSTTPGVDDTPYIRFAIDQLTRDEEVRGSRKYPANNTDDYPVNRLISHDAASYVPQIPSHETPERNPTRPPPMEPLNCESTCK